MNISNLVVEFLTVSNEPGTLNYFQPTGHCILRSQKVF